jgi:hypothetical protein
MSLTEQEVIELAKDAGFLDDDAYVQRYELKKFANALHAKFIEQLGEPKAFSAFADNGNIRVWTSAPDDVIKLSQQVGMKLLPLYALPDEVK